jgi:hypothetical protein
MFKLPFSHDDTDGVELFPHTPNHFCPDMTCPDKEDPEAIGQVAEWVKEGIMSTEDADRFYRGKVV